MNIELIEKKLIKGKNLVLAAYTNIDEIRSKYAEMKHNFNINKKDMFELSYISYSYFWNNLYDYYDSVLNGSTTIDQFDLNKLESFKRKFKCNYDEKNNIKYIERYVEVMLDILEYIFETYVRKHTKLELYTSINQYDLIDIAQFFELLNEYKFYVKRFTNALNTEKWDFSEGEEKLNMFNQIIGFYDIDTYSIYKTFLEYAISLIAPGFFSSNYVFYENNIQFVPEFNNLNEEEFKAISFIFNLMTH